MNEWVPWPIYRSWRRLSAPARMRPNYIIIGAQKCGTDSLSTYLESHPQVKPAATKEIHYFDNHYKNGMGWYRQHFPLDTHGSCVTGEATPTYLLHPLVPERLACALPNVRLIVLLRDPVARAWSHYHHSVRWKFETLPFPDAVAAEERRLDGEEARIMSDPRHVSRPYQRFSYLKRGLYLEQIQRYVDRFGRDRILVLESEDLFSETQTVFDCVLPFLGLNPWPLRNIETRNKGRYTKTLTEEDPELARHLYDYFRPHNEALYRFLGKNFGWEANCNEARQLTGSF